MHFTLVPTCRLMAVPDSTVVRAGANSRFGAADQSCGITTGRAVAEEVFSFCGFSSVSMLVRDRSVGDEEDVCCCMMKYTGNVACHTGIWKTPYN